MKKILLLSLPLLLVLAAVVFFARPAGKKSADGEKTIMLKYDGQVKKISLSEYLYGVTAGEMPASFEAEALKAQTVAARTYAMRRMEETPHEGFDLCAESACCAAYLGDEELREKWGDAYEEYSKKIRAAVSDTDGEYIVWGGEPILAVFHSCSSGVTEDSGGVWLQSLPYLASVATPESAETVPGLNSTLRMSFEEIKRRVAAEYPGTSFLDDPRSLISQVYYTESGRVKTLCVGDRELTGSRFRLLLGLRSTDFSFRVEGDDLVFSVKGYGHGVGLSQYGANLMAQQGRSYKEILAAYYTGTEIKKQEK